MHRFAYTFLITAALALPSCELAGEADAKAQGSLMPTTARYVATAVGRVDSRSEARQLVAAVDGVIAKVLVQRGERVEAGQLLLQVACEPRRAQAWAGEAEAARSAAAARSVLDGAREQEIAAARTVVASAEAARADARDRLVQAEALVGKGFIARRDLDARRNALAIAEAEVGRAEAEASLIVEGARGSDRQAVAAAARAAQGRAAAADALARQCNLVSPVAGDVLQIFRREGEFSGASQGTPLIAVADLSQLLVRAEINERDAARVKVGQRADIWIEGDAQRWQGRIVNLASVMGRRSARSLDPTDRFDRDVREAFVAPDGPMPPALVGLRVMVGVKP
jgi:multidrug resistance efflux pump